MYIFTKLRWELEKYLLILACFYCILACQALILRRGTRYAKFLGLIYEGENNIDIKKVLFCGVVNNNLVI